MATSRRATIQASKTADSAASELMSSSAANTGRNVRQFSRPDGRIVHIAHSPEELEDLKRTLSKQHRESDFDIYLRSSPEHVETIRELHAHHEDLRKQLEQKYGDVYSEFENVHNTLDTLNSELNNLTDQDVSLSANFSKFGYNAHIRTREAPESSGSSMHSGSGDGSEDHVQIRFWKRPSIRQYFHKGIIWRATEMTEVMAFELFVDLVYVGIVGVIGDSAAGNPTGSKVVQSIVLFILSWKLWSELQLVISWFDSNDVTTRISVLFFTVCLVGFTVNIEDAFAEDGNTYTELISFYLAERLFEGFYFVWMAYLVPMIRGMMLTTAIINLIPISIFIVSVHLSYPIVLAPIWLAIMFEIFSSGTIILVTRTSDKWENTRFARLTKHFQFYPAVNVEHRTARTDAFVQLIFGYAVFNVLFSSRAGAGVTAFFGKAVLAIINAFIFNMIYFEIDAVNLKTHAIRRHAISYMFWMYLHIPFILAFTFASGALAKLVLARDCGNSAIEGLAEVSLGNSSEVIAYGLKWFYSAGLGVALACMGGIAISHEHKDIKHQRLRKRDRLAFRFCAAAILICLPAASGLNSLQLMAISSGLLLTVSMVEIYGMTCTTEAFWMDGSACGYYADCKLRRKDLKAMASGDPDMIEDIIRRHQNEKGEIDLS